MHGLILLTLITLEFIWRPGAGGPAPSSYVILTSDVSGNYNAAVKRNVGLPTPDAEGKIHYVWQNWDADTSKYVVVRSANALGESPNSNEISTGFPRAPQAFSVERP